MKIFQKDFGVITSGSSSLSAGNLISSLVRLPTNKAFIKLDGKEEIVTAIIVDYPKEHLNHFDSVNFEGDLLEWFNKNLVNKIYGIELDITVIFQSKDIGMPYLIFHDKASGWNLISHDVCSKFGDGIFVWDINDASEALLANINVKLDYLELCTIINATYPEDKQVTQVMFCTLDGSMAQQRLPRLTPELVDKAMFEETVVEKPVKEK